MSDREITLLFLLIGAGALYWYSTTPTGAAFVSSATDAIAGAFVNRGIRNCNPGNIRRTSIQWRNSFATQAACESAGRVWDPDFVVFFTMPDGERALGHQLITDIGRGQNTVRLILAGDPDAGLYGYAPASENDTESYISDVCAAVGVADSTNLDTGYVPSLASAIMARETGYVEDPDTLFNAVYS
jgi:hypothetical protein